MIAIKKYFFQIAALLLLIMPAVCWADFGIRNTEATENVGGTIPVICKLFVTGEGYPDLFSSITPEDFQVGFIETNEGNLMLTVISNTQWKVMVNAEFKPVGKYTKPASDLLVKIRNKNVMDEGSCSGGMFNEAFVDFGALSKEEQVLWMNHESGDYSQARIDYKVLLSPAIDIPGKYSVEVTYTISAP
jgi:hypothetical protein